MKTHLRQFLCSFTSSCQNSVQFGVTSQDMHMKCWSILVNSILHVCVQVNKTHIAFRNTLTVALSKEEIISRRDLKIIWKCVYPRHYAHNTQVSVGMEWWDKHSLCLSVFFNTVYVWTQKENVKTHHSMVVGCPRCPWWSSARRCSWDSPWRCSLMSLTPAATGGPQSWGMRTPCFSRWPCTQTALLLQTCSCRWTHAGPLRVPTQRTESRVSYSRTGRWKRWTDVSVACWDWNFWFCSCALPELQHTLYDLLQTLTWIQTFIVYMYHFSSILSACVDTFWLDHKKSSHLNLHLRLLFPSLHSSKACLFQSVSSEYSSVPSGVQVLPGPLAWAFDSGAGFMTRKAAFSLLDICIYSVMSLQQISWDTKTAKLKAVV